MDKLEKKQKDLQSQLPSGFYCQITEYNEEAFGNISGVIFGKRIKVVFSVDRGFVEGSICIPGGTVMDIEAFFKSINRVNRFPAGYRDEYIEGVSLENFLSSVSDMETILVDSPDKFQ